MGEWYEYRIRFQNREKDLIETMKQDHYASAVERRENQVRDRICIYVREIDNKIRGMVINNKDTTENGYLRQVFQDKESFITEIDSRINSLVLYHKWTPDLTIPLAISALYPEDVLECMEYSPYYDKDYTIYIKAGAYCNRDGEPIVHELYEINPKLIKAPINGRARVSLPIGDNDDNRWGTFTVKESDISPIYSYSDFQIYAYNTVFFTSNDPITVTFRDHAERITPEEIIQRHLDRIREYRDYATEQMVLENVSEENIRSVSSDNDGYYIVSVHVPTDVSSNGILSFAASQYEVTDGTDGKNICLGNRKKERCCRKDGDTHTPYYVLNEKVKEYYDNNPQLELEDDREM